MKQLQDLSQEELIQEITILQGTLTNLASDNANKSVTIANLQYQVQVLENQVQSTQNQSNGDDE